MSYRTLLDAIRRAFPQPLSDPVHDSTFVQAIRRALERIDEKKSSLPILGALKPPDYAGAWQATLAEHGAAFDQVADELVEFLEGVQIYGHPGVQQNVITQPSFASLIGVLLAALYNPNLVWDDHGGRFALAEVEVSAMMSRLVGYDPTRTAGVFTFGGTATTLYGVKLGLEKCCPGTMRRGLGPSGDETPRPALVFASDASHYCRSNVAGWLGLGTEQVRVIPTRADNQIDLGHLERSVRAALREGAAVAAIIVTLGTTDAFGLDDLEAIADLRDRLVVDFKLPYRPHIHADAVIGWAWAVFNDYDLEANPLGFGRYTLRALAGATRRIRHLHRADSIGVDFHKTGFAPYVSSLFLLKERDDLLAISRAPEEMPYLGQASEYRPGMFTLETSRGGGGAMAAWANLRLLGRRGMQALIGHLVEMTQLLREGLERAAAATILNCESVGTVTVFRVYPPGVDAFALQEREFGDPAARDSLLRHNDYNCRIHRFLQDEALAGRGVMLSLTECYRRTSYGEPIVGLKSFILSPFVDEEHVEAVVRSVLEARQRGDRQD